MPDRKSTSRRSVSAPPQPKKSVEIERKDMMPEEPEFDRQFELRELSQAVAKLAEDPKAFQAAYEAYLAKDTERFNAILEKIGLAERCERICYFFCRKHCVALCRRFCPTPADEKPDVKEMIAFAQAMARLTSDEKALRRVLDIFDAEDVEAWQRWVKEHEFGRFCHQLCHFLCDVRCKLVCRDLCPPKPLITRVGSIPVSQISPSGLGNGPSIPPFHVSAPNPPAVYGDHPFGASVWLMGVFNFPAAAQYQLEVSSGGPAGPYTPVIVSSVQGYNWISVSPYIVPSTRYPSTGADPGWFNVADICDSDGGATALGEKTLLYWPTGGLADGLYHLRLRVRNASTTRTSAPQPVYLDNSGPFPLPRPTISLQLQKPDGTRHPLKCGKVRKGDGLIVVTIHAHDPHYAGVSVTARGNSGLSVAVVDTSSTPLSKTYNGSPSDQGYPIPTEFLWDPWSNPLIVPCCYVVYVEINDRAILNDHYSGGHSNSGWEAIEIGF
jgi:hypothetical protein